MKTEKEEGIKTENLEGNESNKNVSSGARGSTSGEISKNGASSQNRTTNNARVVSQAVANDRKQTLTPQIAVRGLIETFGMRATTIYNSMNINKAPPIPNRLNIDSTDTNNNNISGADNVIKNEENSISVNNIDNKVNTYDTNNISGVDNIIQNGENKNLVNNSSINMDIYDNIRNTLGKENMKLELVDSYPLNLRMDNSIHTENETIIATNTPILRLRGGVGEEEKEEQTVEETVGERFI
jgi:hypothetical protein